MMFSFEELVVRSVGACGWAGSSPERPGIPGITVLITIGPGAGCGRKVVGTRGGRGPNSVERNGSRL
jgi:hypothetical protein